MKVRFTLSIGMANAKQEETVEFPDDTRDSELEGAWQNWANLYIDGGYRIIDDRKDD